MFDVATIESLELGAMLLILLASQYCRVFAVLVFKCNTRMDLYIDMCLQHLALASIPIVYTWALAGLIACSQQQLLQLGLDQMPDASSSNISSASSTWFGFLD